MLNKREIKITKSNLTNKLRFIKMKSPGIEVMIRLEDEIKKEEGLVDALTTVIRMCEALILDRTEI